MEECTKELHHQLPLVIKEMIREKDISKGIVTRQKRMTSSSFVLSSPSSIYKGDIVQVVENSTYFYTVIRASEINLFLRCFSLIAFNLFHHRLYSLLAVMISKYYLNPDIYHAKFGILLKLAPLYVSLLSC